MELLLPDRLRNLWAKVDRNELTADEFTVRQIEWLGAYRRIWEDGLRLAGFTDLETSLLRELAEYTGCHDPVELRRRCLRAVETVKGEWSDEASRGDGDAIVRFYDQSQDMLFELMWWHTLTEDNSPLGYVSALQFARQRGCRRYLDFGAGVGAGGLLFGRHGFEATLADISTPLQQFCRWRTARHNLPARFLDLKTAAFPPAAYDFVTAMDVFEHLPDPVRTVEQLHEALQPGGYLFARLHAEIDEQRPQHIVQDFGATFQRLHDLGFVEVWRDEWLWGHQVFQKA